MRKIDKYRIGLCPFCDEQGLVIIVKEKQTKILYVSCDECETQWCTPDEFISGNCLHSINTFGLYESPTFDEIKEKGWDKYIVGNLPE